MCVYLMASPFLEGKKTGHQRKGLLPVADLGEFPSPVDLGATVAHYDANAHRGVIRSGIKVDGGKAEVLAVGYPGGDNLDEGVTHPVRFGVLPDE